MEHRSEERSASAVLVGEAIEDWTGDAIFYEYSVAADPIGTGSVSPVPPLRFSPDLHAGGSSRVVPLDLSHQLGVPYPATSPGLLASFVVLTPGEAITTRPDATSELLYCLQGRGHTTFTRQLPLGDRPSERNRAASGHIEWSRGDVVTLPAGCTAVHSSDRDRALLYRVTDAPLLRYLGASPTEGRFEPTRFDGQEASERLAAVERDPASAGRSRVSLLLGSSATPQTLTATHTLWAMIGVLPVDRVQQPHRHQSVALDLITSCAPGCYSLIGTRLDSRGDIVDPVRVDWEAAGAFVTPPGLWHSHHNESGQPAYLVPVQDAGLHTYLRSLDIQFRQPED